VSSTDSSRLQFIDLLRGGAVLVMIETHVVNALLRPEIKSEWFFPVLTFINGLVAPSFLFCAGLALALSLHRKWKVYASMEKPFWKYLLRLLFILVVAYSLHLPFFSLTKLRNLPAADPAWFPFYQTDVLQTIAVSLFLLVALAVLSRKSGVFLWVTGAVAAVFVFAAPVVRELDFAELSPWLRPYLTTRVKTMFPLFPWGAFVLTGALCGWWYLQAKKDGYERTFIRKLSAGAAAAIVAALIVELLPLTFYPNHNFWKSSPEFFIVRDGIVILMLAGLWQMEQRRKYSDWSPLLIFGRESLLVYVVHLLIVYGYTYEFSFVRFYGPHLNYLECLPLVAGLTAAMYGLAVVWHWLKRWNGRLAWFTEVCILAAIILMFLTREY
jgi:uncharacterized membrane protein